MIVSKPAASPLGMPAVIVLVSGVFSAYAPSQGQTAQAKHFEEWLNSHNSKNDVK
jgi:hypothetical protein